MATVSLQGATVDRRSLPVDTRRRPLPRDGAASVSARAAGGTPDTTDDGRSVRSRSEQGSRQARTPAVQSGLPYVVHSGRERPLQWPDGEEAEEPVLFYSVGVEGSSGLFRI